MNQFFSNNDLKINTLYETDTEETLDLKPHVKFSKMHTVKLYFKKEDFTITVEYRSTEAINPKGDHLGTPYSG